MREEMSIEINESVPDAPGTAVSSDRPIPVDPRAATVLAELAGQDGAAVEATVIAALADMPTAAAVRHLRQLERLRLVTRPAPGRYSCDPQTARAQGITPSTSDEAASTRVTAWYLATVFAAARVLGAAALPGAEVIDPDPDRPTIGSRRLSPRRAGQVPASVHAAWITRLRPVDSMRHRPVEELERSPRDLARCVSVPVSLRGQKCVAVEYAPRGGEEHCRAR